MEAVPLLAAPLPSFKSTDLVTPVMRTNSIIAPKSGTAMGTTATIGRVIQIPSGWGYRPRSLPEHGLTRLPIFVEIIRHIRSALKMLEPSRLS